MQDYNYIWGNCVEITLELSCCKYPHRHELPRFWQENKKALLVYLGQVHRGIRGLIMDSNGNLIPKATLKIKSRNVTFKSSSRGEYWRVLLPGVYTVEIFADGYHPAEKTFTVNENQITNLNIQLLSAVSRDDVEADNSNSVSETNAPAPEGVTESGKLLPKDNQATIKGPHSEAATESTSHSFSHHEPNINLTFWLKTFLFNTIFLLNLP